MFTMKTNNTTEKSKRKRNNKHSQNQVAGKCSDIECAILKSKDAMKKQMMILKAQCNKPYSLRKR